MTDGVRSADGVPKTMRIVIGIMLMTAFVLVSWSLVSRYAGGWGVPYFSFRTERGSLCDNDLTGYTCTEMTVPDIEFYGDVVLPQSTAVVTSRYRATHDYQLEAQLRVPAADADAALAGLNESFGPCRPDRPAPMSTTGLTTVCVLVNDDTVANGADTSSRLYAVGTGLRRDGTRVIVMDVRSR